MSDLFSEYWLVDNAHIWRRFEHESLRIAVTGRRHYSARTIIEYMRHETALTQVPGEFKINGNYVPDLARLFALLHSDHRDLFEFRVQAQSSKRVA